MSNLQAGLIGTAETIVNETNIAKTMKSGSLPVFATPALCALMEEAACNAVAGCLAEDMGTVGISLNISHDAPTALGKKVTATAQLTAVEGRKLTFTVLAADEYGAVGKGVHTRFVIDNDKFMGKLLQK